MQVGLGFGFVKVHGFGFKLPNRLSLFSVWVWVRVEFAIQVGLGFGFVKIHGFGFGFGFNLSYSLGRFLEKIHGFRMRVQIKFLNRFTIVIFSRVYLMIFF